MEPLRGARVSLRTLTIDDAAEMLDLRRRNRTFFTPYEPMTTDSDFTPKAIRQSLQQAIDEERDDRAYSFGICEIDGGALVGRIRLTNVFRGPWQNANLGYYVDEAVNGRGYATEAVRLATSFGFDVAKLHRVQAGVMSDNHRSIRVLEKAGFRREGVALAYLNIHGSWRDHAIFAVTTEEWD